ncbi:AlbA family DNA-binding domain-containing protein [Actinocatenispora rupis]|uniref:Schlafen AlbA-2 domain-containing protein n=1 Tax=Actinocatenispora rupis TaxID=519421 RepID=A0A8J3NE08_9ACTN|nr:ATP-binding protein [Actinocatenispora rupis]GID15561.1 hypothetical protein Aru02nite_64500 [Actinocatenispora rupis]
MTVYLGIEASRRTLATWNDLQDAVDGGLLDESHWLELTTDLPNRPSANTELARELASLAVDGGTLIVGVQAKDSRAEKVAGVPLAEARQRIVRAAESYIHPRLYFHLRPIMHPDEDDVACIVVEVPPSGQAPHQVDFEYFGRGDLGKLRLADDRVRELLSVRSVALQRTGTELAAMADRFPLPARTREFGHLYVIADPVDADRNLLSAVLDEDDRTSVYNAVDRAAATLRPELTGSGHLLRDGTAGWRSRPRGLALTRTADRHESGVLDYLVRRDGGIETTCGSGTRYHDADWARDLDFTTVPCTWLLGVVHSTLALAAAFTEVSHYRGRWQLGVRFDGMRYAAAEEAVQGVMGWQGAAQYDADEYEMLTSTVTAELIDETPALVERLVGDFLRGLGVQSRFLPYPEWHGHGRVAPPPRP